ncbi:hypothetical protein WG954_15695 [Lacibacter sp. H375]|uniref:hypothetical protein n=1 Tax=Lacibacter sp. H375 TaxID=3133424 RepID=UPI0030BC24DB
MKRILILFLLAIAFVSCKKDSATSKIESQLIGEWELEAMSNMNGSTLFAPGNGNILLFEKGNVHKRKKNNMIIFEGNFSIQIKNDCLNTGRNTFLSTTDPNPIDMYISIEEGTLHLSTPNCYTDGGYLKYRKL